MTAPLILVRLVGTGECVEVEPSARVLFLGDVAEPDRDLVIIGFRTSAVDAQLWRTVRPCVPAFVAEDDSGERWHLAEIPDCDAPTLPAPEGGAA